MAKAVVSGEPPQIDMDMALSYRKRFDKLRKTTDPKEAKKLLRKWVEKIELAPEDQVISITYRLPEPVVRGMVAVTGFEPMTFGLKTRRSTYRPVKAIVFSGEFRE